MSDELISKQLALNAVSWDDMKTFEEIENLPPVDAVEVVRCKDCKFSIDFYQDGSCYCRLPEKELYYKGESWNGYCEKGERRGE